MRLKEVEKFYQIIKFTTFNCMDFTKNLDSNQWLQSTYKYLHVQRHPF